MLRINKILAAEDFSECSDAALGFALDLAQRHGAEVHVLYAQVHHGDPFAPPAYPARHNERVRQEMEKRVKAQAETLGSVDLGALEVAYAVIRDVAAAPAILGYAEEHDVDLIVMGTHGKRGLRRLILGSVAEEVVQLAKCPVLTIGSGQEGKPPTLPIRSIVAPTDFSQHALVALRYARELADFYHAHLDIVHVVEEAVYPAFYNVTAYSIYDTEPDLEEQAGKHLKKLYQNTIGPPKDVDFHVLTGHAAPAITNFVREHESSMIVMATHGLTGLAHLFIGSVAEKVVRTAPCPVFTVKSLGKSLLEDGEPAMAEAAS
ncbi:universal stress protein [Rhodocaloribacter sp.]